MLVCWSTARIATDPYGDGLFDKMEHFQIAYDVNFHKVGGLRKSSGDYGIFIFHIVVSDMWNMHVNSLKSQYDLMK